ncbi:heparinase II/III family protein [Cryptosporangium minutisporangium]|uniref:Heparin-sulfate lyase N-terminal domain-containing protein n=1 Tax=Cryptosporangium minutisporangium TaxID=113569 RepID=A0ABP6SUS1_9ACTN
MRRRLSVVLAVLLGGTACAAPPPEPLTVSIPVPQVAPTPPPRPLPLGVESVYGLFNNGEQADADALLRGVWRINRYRDAALPTPLTWREDPYRDQYWRFVFYSLRPLSNLLWAHYRVGAPRGDTRYRDELVEILRSYVRFDARPRVPDRKGIDYPHSIAFRAMALTNISVKLARSGDLPADLRGPLLAALGRAGRALADPVNYEGNHNHGFSEAAALLLLQRVFPQLEPDGSWGHLARARLAGFMTQIVDADGVEIEKSPFYHFYVLDFALALQNWGRRTGTALSPGFDDRTHGMLRYATDITWPDGSIPLFGSSVRLRPERSAELYAPLNHPELAYVLSSGAAGRPPAARAVLFRTSGQAVLRAVAPGRRDARNRTQLLVDVGPPRTTHSHPAALALLYYSAGRELLPDSGLYTYAKGSAADYFREARAHNTVVVDGRPNGPGPVRAGRTLTGPTWAYQSGAAAVYPGVLHRRAVLLLRQDLAVVVDRLTGAGVHDYAQHWHLFPGARVVSGPTLTTAYDQRDEPVLQIRQAIGSRVKDQFGEQRPMQGWHSAEYGKAVRNHAVSYSVTGRTATYVTLLASGRYASRPTSLRTRINGDAVRASVCADGVRLAATITAAPRETVAVTTAGTCDVD